MRPGGSPRPGSFRAPRTARRCRVGRNSTVKARFSPGCRTKWIAELDPASEKAWSRRRPRRLHRLAAYARRFGRRPCARPAYRALTDPNDGRPARSRACRCWEAGAARDRDGPRGAPALLADVVLGDDFNGVFGGVRAGVRRHFVGPFEVAGAGRVHRDFGVPPPGSATARRDRPAPVVASIGADRHRPPSAGEEGGVQFGVGHVRRFVELGRGFHLDGADQARRISTAAVVIWTSTPYSTGFRSSSAALRGCEVVVFVAAHRAGCFS